MVFKIQDTIVSLRYPNPRLFGIQVSGSTPIEMLEEVARITNGHYLPPRFAKKDVERLIREWEKTFSSGQTYSFLIFNEDVKEEKINKEVLPYIDVNWKMVTIDEALCMGPNPTAFDRLLASKLAQQVFPWIQENSPTGDLLIKSRNVIFLEK
ncbi:hypothetical protein [Niallia sp. Krafla_26]|uniref:hypothetical protein n=1 Tax=Niallia sp. Krafla_26 TaxID=3064703 RepID=UPI003D18128B